MEEEKINYQIRPEVITYEDVCQMASFFRGKPKLVRRIFKFLSLDKVNRVHSTYCNTPGIPFSRALIEDEFKIKLRVDNEQVLNSFAGQAFITVSNHPFGAFDGITLLHLVGRHRPDYKVMVNLFLNHLSAMRPSFIAVDPSGSNDPEKKKVTLQGIREAMTRTRDGHPIGFFPAGAVSKVNKRLRIRDREWQPAIVKLIAQMGVPVVPIFFHGRNSTFFNILGIISWKIRTLRLPAEVFRRKGKEIHVTVGDPIMPQEIQQHAGSVKELGNWLRARTYALGGEKA